jgi:hypothetical protein
MEEQLLALVGGTMESPVEAVSVDEFFVDLTTSQDWHGDDEKTTVERYRRLLGVIQNQLLGATVFRVGEVKVAIYIVGRTEDGSWAGVKTTAVET